MTEPFWIRPLKTIEDCQATEDLQRRAWGVDDVDIAPAHLLLTVGKNGGVVLGAYTAAEGGEQLIGFVFGFLGTREGRYSPEAPAQVRLKHCSHMMGVDPEWQSQGVGYALKLAQREAARAQALHLITWTYDPLESRNAHLNISKLGAVCNTYFVNVYGNLRDDLNRGLSSDRFQVDWWIASKRVETRLTSNRPGLTRDLYEKAGTPLINPAGVDARGLPLPAETVQPMTATRALIEFPAVFQDVKRLDSGLAHAWRAHTREIFQAAFAAGFSVTDMLYERGVSPRAFYVVTYTGPDESVLPE